MTTPPKTTATAQEVRQGSLGWLIQTIAAAMNAQMDAELAPIGLTRHQFGVLMILLEQEGISQAEIGKRIRLPGYATTRGMDALEAMGFVIRRPDETSRRAYRVFLTDKGRALAPTLFGIVRDVNGRMAKGLGEAERDSLFRGLQAMSENARAL